MKIRSCVYCWLHSACKSAKNFTPNCFQFISIFSWIHISYQYSIHIFVLLLYMAPFQTYASCMLGLKWIYTFLRCPHHCGPNLKTRSRLKNSRVRTHEFLWGKWQVDTNQASRTENNREFGNGNLQCEKVYPLFQMILYVYSLYLLLVKPSQTTIYLWLLVF